MEIKTKVSSSPRGKLEFQIKNSNSNLTFINEEDLNKFSSRKLSFSSEKIIRKESILSTAAKSQKESKYSLKIKIGPNETYEGEVDENYVINGYGTYMYPNGDVYEGDFKNGLKHGRGEYLYTDDSSYIGDWLNDEKHGNGVFKFDKYEINAEWKEDKIFNGLTFKINVFERKQSEIDNNEDNESENKSIGYDFDDGEANDKNKEINVRKELNKYNIQIELMGVQHKGNKEVFTRNLYKYDNNSDNEEESNQDTDTKTDVNR